MFIVNIHRVANAIARQRSEAIKRLKNALNMGLSITRDVNLRYQGTLGRYNGTNIVTRSKTWSASRSTTT